VNEQDTFYLDYYEKVCGQGLIGKVAAMTHKSIENQSRIHRRHEANGDPQLQLDILEVGSGHGQHIKFVKSGFTSYLQTDLRPDLLNGQAEMPKVFVHAESVDAENLPFGDSTFDRVIATCLLAHLPNPEKALEEWQRVTRNNGEISIYLACEPGLLLRFSQFLTTRRRQKSFGVPGNLVHYREHKNMYVAMKVFLQNSFGDSVKIKRFPLPWLSWNFNLWAVATVRVAKPD
jgi:phosphatidylethanolamine/phosphatidyl-N-methylethanolamine N-methyltransferase